MDVICFFILALVLGEFYILISISIDVGEIYRALLKITKERKNIER